MDEAQGPGLAMVYRPRAFTWPRQVMPPSLLCLSARPADPLPLDVQTLALTLTDRSLLVAGDGGATTEETRVTARRTPTPGRHEGGGPGRGEDALPAQKSTPGT